jgi:hypothetical protein
MASVKMRCAIFGEREEGGARLIKKVIRVEIVRLNY